MNDGVAKVRDLSVDLAKIVGMLLVVFYYTLGYCRADWTREVVGPISQ